MTSITLRPRQSLFVERCLSALHEHGNTLGISPTGGGKSIMLAAVAAKYLQNDNGKVCVLAHRDELTSQNEAKFKRLNPRIRTSLFDAGTKSWHGQATFAMVPTLAQPRHLSNMPAMDLLVIDETHHATAKSYQRIIDAVKSKNEKAHIFGVTATAMRGDKAALDQVFTNVGDQISLSELIDAGHLVKPRTYTIDLGTVRQLEQVGKHGNEYDMQKADAILNKDSINEAVVRHWQEKAAGRQTVVFCSSIEHSERVCEAFTRAGIKSTTIDGMLSRAERAIRIQRFDQGEIQILINTFVLTEGFDSQPVSCVVLLRPSSHHSTYIQMIGRGLRTVDQAMYPRMQKDDCVILDFGTSTKEHGTLEQAVDLSPSKGQGKAPYKECFECGVRVAPKQMACPECGFEFGMESVDKQVDFDMVEVNTRLSDDAKIEWVDLFADNTVWFAHSRYNWCGVFAYQGKHHVVVGSRKAVTGVVYQGHFQTAIERAERWLQTQGAIDNIFTSTKYYANEPTESQLCQLPMSLRFNFNLTRYQAMCHLTLSRHKQAIFDVMTNDELDREVA